MRGVRNPIMILLTLAKDASEKSLSEEAFSLAQALPIEAHVALGIMLIGGLLLWLFGGKILKPIFGLAGLVVGGTVGLIALPAFGVEAVAGTPGSLVGLAAGAIIGLVLALVALKAAIVVAAGLGFAAAGFLGGAIYLSYNPLPSDELPAQFEVDESDRSSAGRLLFENPYTGEKMTIDQLTEALREANSFLGGGLGRSSESEPDASDDEQKLRAIAVRGEAIVREGYDMAKGRWNALSSRERLVVAGSTVGGLALGLFVGFFMPKKATAMVTALAGSAVWLTAAVVLVDAYVPTLRGVTDQPPAVWAFVWAFAFLLGLVVQLAGLGRSAGGSGGKKKAKTADGEGEKKDEKKEDKA